MDYIDYKYCGYLSSRFDKFTIKNTNPYRANFRCYLCGDSQKSNSKKRGWLLEKDNHIFYYCHNCNASLNLRNLLYQVDISIYNDYIIEKKLNLYKKPVNVNTESDNVNHNNNTVDYKSFLKKLKKISQLTPNHPAKRYVDNRQIPTNKHYRIYYCQKFVYWINSIVPNKIKNTEEHSRIIFPIYDRDKQLIGVQGRLVNNNNSNLVRYITVMFDENKPKVFGIESVDFDSKYYITEGPIDSLFLSNSIAMVGSSIDYTVIENKDNGVFVFDCEPRNKQIVSKMEKTIDYGYKIAILPNSVPGKDINDLVLNNYRLADIQLLIDRYTYSGLRAKLELKNWRKVY